LPETGKDPRRFGNFLGLASLFEANSTKFGRPPAKVLRSTRGL